MLVSKITKHDISEDWLLLIFSIGKTFHWRGLSTDTARFWCYVWAARTIMWMEYPPSCDTQTISSNQSKIMIVFLKHALRGKWIFALPMNSPTTWNSCSTPAIINIRNQPPLMDASVALALKITEFLELTASRTIEFLFFNILCSSPRGVTRV